jgi:hypothetical protein
MEAVDTALIGLLGALLGIAVTALFTRLLEVKKRSERETELVIAIHAEIVAGYDASTEQTKTEERAKLLVNDLPFGPADETDHVFNSIKSDLTILPMSVIHEVISYYKLASQSNLYTNDFKHVLYEKQSPEERRAYRRNLIDLLDAQNKAAERAIRALEREAASRGINLKQKRLEEPSTFLSDERPDRS